MPKTFKTYLPAQGSLYFEFLDKNGIQRRAVNLEDNSIWYFSDGVKMFGSYFKDSTRDFHVELAVVTGRIYRLLLGSPHPQMYSCKDENGKIYRFSKEISDLVLWSELGKQDTFIPGTRLVKVADTYKFFLGFMKMLVACYFVFDADGNPSNYGLSPMSVNDTHCAVKIDPECGLNDALMLEESEEDIYEELKNWGIDKADDEINDEHESSPAESVKIYKDCMGFVECILNLLIPENGFSKSKEIIQYLLLSSEAQIEKFQILAKIISIPLKTYLNIIEECISTKYSEEKTKLTEIIEKRWNYFKNAALRLQGFPEFFEQYSKIPSHHGSVINPSYNCYIPNYQDEETIDQFKKRLEKADKPWSSQFFKETNFYAQEENKVNIELTSKKQRIC